MSKTKTLRTFRRHHPRRYQAVPIILECMASQTAQAITEACGTNKPKIREVAIGIDFKRATPVATLHSRYLHKWSKMAEFPIKPTSEFNFAPVVASR